jgi:transposase-like protein
LHLALGAGVCTRIEQTLPTASEAGQQERYRIDETYIKVKGADKYLYRAVDSTGQTIDVLLTAKRDKATGSSGRGE